MLAVTQARGSGDYRAGNGLWQRLGVTGLLLFALGLGCSKDTFWTAPRQPGNRWGDQTIEHHPRLQAAVATLSRGPVAPSDAIGRTDARLLMRSAAADGTLLQASEPVTIIDDALLAAARGQPIGDVWFGETIVGGRRYGTLFAAHVPRALELHPNALGYGEGAGAAGLLAMDAVCDAPPGRACPARVGIPPLWRCGTDFQLWSVGQREATGHWTLLGEVNKWVAVSAARFRSIEATESALTVSARGQKGERVTLAFAPPEGNASSAQQALRVHVLMCTIVATKGVRVQCSRGQPIGSMACRCL